MISKEEFAEYLRTKTGIIPDIRDSDDSEVLRYFMMKADGMPAINIRELEEILWYAGNPEEAWQSLVLMVAQNAGILA